ncbi:peptidoglycan-binding domain-containing protein [Geitlerinema sp. P-1104]
MRFGLPKTTAAVKEFQEQRNLNVDGIVGLETLIRVRSLL